MANFLDVKHAASDEYHSSLNEPRKSTSLSMACDFYHDPFCEICADSRDRNIKPDGYCNDCVQFLCVDCLRVHRRLQAARGHVIRKGDDMPKSMADKPPKYDYCDIHLRCRKDQFCGKHRVLLCSQCVPLQHKYCPVKDVDDVCKDVRSPEIDILHDKIKDFKTNLSSVVEQIGFTVAELDNNKEHLLKNEEDIADIMTAQIKTLLEEIKSETESAFQTQATDLRQCENMLICNIANLEGTLDDIKKMKGRSVDVKMFLRIQDMMKDIEQFKRDVANLKTSTINIKMTFVPDKRVEKFLSESFKLGSIYLDKSQSDFAIAVPEILFPASPARTKPVSHTDTSGQISRLAIPISQMRAQKIGSYDVKRPEDDEDCNILSMAITNDGRPLLVDDYHRTIKLYSRDMRFLYRLSLSTYPTGITVTGDREAVVSDGEDKLVIIDISESKINIKGTVRLPYTVVDVAAYRDKFLVTPRSTWPRSVELVDRSGRIYWSANTDQEGQKLFSFPRYVTCHDDGESAVVIVTDYSVDTLTVLNAASGAVITRRKVTGKCPEGVSTDTVGNIYVSYHTTHEVAVLSKDLSETKIILSKRDGLSDCPQAIVYSAVDNQLVISNVPHGSVSPTVECFKLI